MPFLKCSEADLLPLCDVANPWNMWSGHCTPVCPGPPMASDYSFLPVTLKWWVSHGGGGEGTHTPLLSLCQVLHLHALFRLHKKPLWLMFLLLNKWKNRHFKKLNIVSKYILLVSVKSWVYCLREAFFLQTRQVVVVSWLWLGCGQEHLCVHKGTS